MNKRKVFLRLTLVLSILVALFYFFFALNENNGSLKNALFISFISFCSVWGLYGLIKQVVIELGGFSK